MADSPKRSRAVHEGRASVPSATATLQPINDQGHAEIVAALAGLNRFVATTHVDDQSVIVIHGDHAVSET
jgi:hypothetical protein